MALVSRYFIDFVYGVVVIKFTFSISSPDGFLVRYRNGIRSSCWRY